MLQVTAMSITQEEHPTILQSVLFLSGGTGGCGGTPGLHEVKDMFPGHIYVTHLGEFVVLSFRTLHPISH